MGTHHSWTVSITRLTRSTLKAFVRNVIFTAANGTRMEDMSTLQSELQGGAETGCWCYFRWFVVFLLLYWQSGAETGLTATGSCIKYDPARERNKGGREGQDQSATAKTHQVEMDSNTQDWIKFMVRGVNELWSWVDLGQTVSTGRGFLWIIHSAGWLIIDPLPASPCFSGTSPSFTIHWPL